MQGLTGKKLDSKAKFSNQIEQPRKKRVSKKSYNRRAQFQRKSINCVYFFARARLPRPLFSCSRRPADGYSVKEN